ncbi:MAG: hypothetical protein U1E17_12710 [Geminicoccaceae bacterium]
MTTARPACRGYCTLSVYAEAVEARLDAGDHRGPGELRRTAASLVTLAVKLRLTPQAVHRRDAGILSERNAAVTRCWVAMPRGCV